MSLRFCRKCVMDGTDPDLILDEGGICNHCHNAQKMLREIEADKPNLPEIIKKIKYDGRNKKYDIIIGISGGVDSSICLHHAVFLGLRPLAFSVDNGWQDDRAQENIMKLVEGLKVPFYRYVIDIKKFHRLQSSFMRAGQINIEICTDHLLMAATYEMASQYGIRWIVSGGNVASESILPKSWGYQPRDLTHIKSVYRWATQKKLKGLPMCGLLKWNWYKWVKKIKTLYLLDYLDYDRAAAIKLLEEKYDWRDYGEKHEESIFTKWFQSFYLFTKFSVDKRKAHYSALINSDQMTRAEAMLLLQRNPEYPKLGIEEKVMKYPKRPHTDFATDERLFDAISKVVRFLRKWKS